MKLIAITSDKNSVREKDVINKLFEQGLTSLHIRKPSHSRAEVRELLCRINPVFHNRIVLHDHFRLVYDFKLKGVHLNRRNPEAPGKENISISCSYHSLDELRMSSSFDYVFLSPVFDSLSKPGYNKRYTHSQLTEARDLGTINDRVYALGGVDANTIPLVSEYGFGGIAVLGALWRNFEKDKDEAGVLQRFLHLKNICEQS